MSRRYAIDFLKSKDGATFSGDALTSVPTTHMAARCSLLPTAESLRRRTVPDNVPRTKAGFRTAVPITKDTIGGNFIVLDLGNGQFAHYAHLQSGTLSVKVGARVRRGQVLARVGGSGDAREPHLHFQVANALNKFAAEGVPYVIDHFRILSADGTSFARTREFPLGDVVIDFARYGDCAGCYGDCPRSYHRGY